MGLLSQPNPFIQPLIRNPKLSQIPQPQSRSPQIPLMLFLALLTRIRKYVFFPEPRQSALALTISSAWEPFHPPNPSPAASGTQPPGAFNPQFPLPEPRASRPPIQEARPPDPTPDACCTCCLVVPSLIPGVSSVLCSLHSQDHGQHHPTTPGMAPRIPGPSHGPWPMSSDPPPGLVGHPHDPAIPQLGPFAPLRCPPPHMTRRTPSTGAALRIHPRIVGGQECEKHSQPWQVAIYHFSTFQCGGVLVAPQWVLTAAHCRSK